MTALGPWRNWIPGVLSMRQVQELRDDRFIDGVKDAALDNSSFDLTLSSDAYELIKGSVKPDRTNFLNYLDVKEKLVRRLDPQPDGTFLLQRRFTYLFRLRERFPLATRLADAGFHGQATAKSSIGRLDVLDA